jgi:hypothetical protein
MMSAKMTARLVAEDVAAGVFADRAASAASGGAPTDLHAAAKLSRAAT